MTMATEVEPNAVEKIKLHNRRDEVYGLLCINIYIDLLFHIDGLLSPDEVCEMLQTLFWNTNEMRGHQIENDLISLSPRSFKSFQVYFSKFKSLVLQLKQCGIDKEDEQLVLAILLKLSTD